MTVVVGVDPGAKGTGLVVADTARRSGSMVRPGLGLMVPAALLDHTTVYRPDGEPVASPSPAYLAAVVEQLAHMVTVYGAHLVAVEGIVPPNPHLNRRNGNAVIGVDYLLAASMVFGAVTSRGYGARLVVVRPGQNGSRALGQYPGELVTSAERRGPWVTRKAGSGAMKDRRSAWDVALAGHAAARTLPLTTTYAY